MRLTDLPARIADRVAPMPDGCWLWMGETRFGYGRTRWDGRSHQAHRLAYELLVGEVPEGLELDHLCRQRSCVNPSHLEPVTRRENVLRGEGITAQQARQTHCQRGHLFDEANTYRPADGGRRCRLCERDRNRRRRASGRYRLVPVEKLQ